METPFERLRLSFKPDKIRVLFLGESVPAGGTFFYQADSRLYFCTREAFSAVLGEEVGWGQDFLNLFKAHGFYLDDLCLVPVNRLDDEKRRRARLVGISSLAERMRTYAPELIIVVGLDKQFRTCVDTAIKRAGVTSIPVFALPFPANAQRNETRYVAGLAGILETLKQTMFKYQ